MRAGESFRSVNAGAATAPVSPNANEPGVLQGGWYRLSVISSSGTVSIQRLGPDNSTYLAVPMQADASASTAAPVTISSGNATYTFWAEPGIYQYVAATGPTIFTITRIPTSE